MAVIISSLIFIFILSKADAIRCYQCSSDQDGSEDDVCGAYNSFNKEKNTLADCFGEEAVTPGTFCYKSIQQSPRGFIWDGRWRTVVRRCAQISERGINWGCDWGYKENGVYWEECYCAEDGCNGNIKLRTSFLVILFLTCLNCIWYLYTNLNLAT
uniref:U98-Liphistoxin-Lth1a_1 n=1 Tax=Liphistius thaleban TaxID=1905330 RepID=A0A4Q8K5V4_9ARAC